MDGEVWHLVEARRDDGAPTIFRIRELAPRLELPRIFVIEMPYPITEMSRLPDASAYRRLATFEEQWVVPACAATGYQHVGLKIEEGSFFLYLYGAAPPDDLIARLAPFDGALGFYDDADPDWGEYATLRDLLDEAKAMMPAEVEQAVTEPVAAAPKPPRTTKIKKTAAPRAATTTPAAKTGVTKAGVTKTGAKKAGAKKTGVKKTGARKAGARKAGAKKAGARKTNAKKAGATKTVARTAVANKTSVTKTGARKAVAKKTSVKKTGATKAGARKTSARKTPARKPPRR